MDPLPQMPITVWEALTGSAVTVLALMVVAFMSEMIVAGRLHRRALDRAHADRDRQTQLAERAIEKTEQILHTLDVMTQKLPRGRSR